MAFFGIVLANIVFTILLCMACGLLLAGIVLLLVGARALKSGGAKRGRGCIILGVVFVGIVAAGNKL